MIRDLRSSRMGRLQWRLQNKDSRLLCLVGNMISSLRYWLWVVRGSKY